MLDKKKEQRTENRASQRISGTMPKGEKASAPKHRADHVRHASPPAETQHTRAPSRRMAATHSPKLNLSARQSRRAQIPATRNVKLLKHNQINLKYPPFRTTFKPPRLLYYKTRPATGRKIALSDAKGQTAQTPAKIENIDTRLIYRRKRLAAGCRSHPQIAEIEFAKQLPLFAKSNNCLLKIFICD